MMFFTLFISCRQYYIYNPANLFVNKDEYVKNSILNNIKFADNCSNTYFFMNIENKNDEIVRFLNENNTGNTYYTMSYINFIPEITYKPLDKENSVFISTSLPVYDCEKKLHCIMVSISIFSNNNWISLNEYYFTFDQINNKNIIKYKSHFKNVKDNNTGPPAYLKQLNYQDSIKNNLKIKFIDSIVKIQNNNIQDSLKLKMGIKRG